MKEIFKDALEENVDYTGVIKMYEKKNGRLVIYVQLDDSEDTEELFINSQKIIMRKKSPYHRFCEEMGLLNNDGAPVLKRLLDMPVIVQLKVVNDGAVFVSSIVRNDYDEGDECDANDLEELTDYCGIIVDYEEKDDFFYIYVELDDDRYKGGEFVSKQKMIMKTGSPFHQFCMKMGLSDTKGNFDPEKMIDMPVIVQLLADKDGNLFICDMKRADLDEEDDE